MIVNGTCAGCGLYLKTALCKECGARYCEECAASHDHNPLPAEDETEDTAIPREAADDEEPDHG